MRIPQACFFILLWGSLSLKYLCFIQQKGYKWELCRKLRAYALVTAGIILISLNISQILQSVIASFYLREALHTVIILLLCALSCTYNKRSRTKFRFTKRGLRFFSVYMLFGIGLLTGLAFIKSPHVYFGISYICLMSVPLFAALTNALLSPVEAARNAEFIKKAKITLERGDLLKIGITGSFGKTGCKNILSVLLSKSYNVVATPESYNTPIGIALSTALLTPSTDVFIAEMGARRSGDVKELCDMVKPKIGIITGVTNQHLETFLTMDNLKKEKFSLAENLPADGFCAFNIENPCVMEMYRAYKGKKLGVGVRGRFYSERISVSEDGTEFDLILDGIRSRVKTKLLGAHNVCNITLCAAVAYKLNVSRSDIIELIGKLEPTKHRLELIKTGGITILDDSYNANIEGAIAALEVLSSFSGRKAVFSQGLAELGKDEEVSNVELGKKIAAVADVVLLTGSKAELINKGLREGGYKKELYRYKSLKDAQKSFPSVLRQGDNLLIQNDLPDIY